MLRFPKKGLSTAWLPLPSKQPSNFHPNATVLVIIIRVSIGRPPQGAQGAAAPPGGPHGAASPPGVQQHDPRHQRRGINSAAERQRRQHRRAKHCSTPAVPTPSL